MIPSEFSFMQEILTNSIYKYDISNEFSNWMKYKHYPAVSWTLQYNKNMHKYGILAQTFRTSYGKWWIPIRLIFIPTRLNIQEHSFWEPYMLSSKEPITNTLYSPGNFIIIDIRQAGKYVSKLFIFIFIHIYMYYISRNYFSALFLDIFEYLLLFS